MKSVGLSVTLLALAFFGLADAWYLADTALRGAELSCNISGLDGCNIVAQSPYSYLFGIPLAVYGALFYAAIFVLAAAVLVAPLRQVYGLLYVLGIIGSLASLYFLIIQVAIIKALCIYCFASALIAFAICALTWHLWRLHRFTRVLSVPIS